MPRQKIHTRSRTTNINNDLETNDNDILPTHNNTETLNERISPEARVPISSNFAKTSKESTISDNTSSDILLGVKRYIDAAFEKQTLELKALFQHLNNATLFSSNTVHDLETDSDTNSNHIANFHSNKDQDIIFTSLTNRSNKPNHKSNQHTSKRPLPVISDINNNNNRNSKKPRTIQGEQHHTNLNFLKEIEDLLHRHTHKDTSNITVSLPTLDITSFPLL